MLANYLKVFFHNLFRQKVITLINIIGLAIGMAVFMLISLYVKEEYSYEQRWNKADRIVRTVDTLLFNPSTTIETELGSPRTLESFREFFLQEIEAGSRVWGRGVSIIVDQVESPGSVNYVDATFLDVFNVEEVSGSLADTLTAPGRIALEQDYALTLFSGQALGKSLMLRMYDGTEKEFEVSAVYRLPEGKGMLEFSTLTLLVEALETTMMDTDFMGTENDWLSGVNLTTFLLLREHTDTARINARSDEFVEQYVRLPWVARDGAPITDFYDIRIQPIRDIYFNPLMNDEGGSRLATNSFALVAALVLLIAICNFVILSVARSAERVSEVGVRKANGASSSQLQGQFLLESLLQVVLASCLALVLFEVVEPLFESLMGTVLLTPLFSVDYVFWGLLMIAVITLLGGMYPAFVLASIKPERALKTGGTVAGHIGLRRALVSFQFTIAVGLIISTMVIYQQLLYVQQRDSGFDADKVVSLAFPNYGSNYATALVNEIPRIAGVDLLTPASRIAGRMSGSGSISVKSMSREREDNLYDLFGNYVGYDFFSLYSIDILAGRVFSQQRDAWPESSTSPGEDNSYIPRIILNESAVRDLGFDSPREAIGQSLYETYRCPNCEEMEPYQREIIGVVADSQFDTLRSRANSEIYELSGNLGQVLSFRVEESAMPTIRGELETIWNEVGGIGNPKVFFGRDVTADTFRQEANEGRLLASFALLAILVSCMGLYGLVAFDTTRRTKEIGVRKVLGGKHGDIQSLFLRQYFWPMLVANIVAWPVVIGVMQQWLQRFPYQIQAWLFVPICILAGLLVIGIAASTLGLTVWQALRTKPAQALRYE